MKPSIIRFGFALMLCSSLGCAMCCGPYDYDYPNFGGKYERADRSYGRVGSLFSDPMANPMGLPADSNLKTPEKKARAKSSDESEEADQLKEKLERELEQDNRSPNQQSPEADKPNPDTKEAFNQYQRPSPLRRWN